MVCDLKKFDNFIYNNGIKTVIVLFFFFFVVFVYKDNSIKTNPVPIRIPPSSFVNYDPLVLRKGVGYESYVINPKFLIPEDIAQKQKDVLQIEKESNENGKDKSWQDEEPSSSISNNIVSFSLPEGVVWPRASNASESVRAIQFETRNDFWSLVPPGGKMVEIGVFDCDFCDINLKNFDNKFAKEDYPMYYAIDIGKTPKLDKRIEMWSKTHPNFQFKMQKGEVAVKDFEDGSLDVIYIDACHRLKCVQKDINMWRPKLKPGGLLSGHDFCVNRNERKTDTYKLTVPWCGTYKTTDPWMNGHNPESPENKARASARAGKEKASQRQSVDAVLKNVGVGKYFATLEGRKHLDDDGTNAPSWYMFYEGNSKY